MIRRAVPPARRLRRLLVLLPSAGTTLGGAEAQTATLVQAIAATGVEVTVAAAPALRDGIATLLGPAAALRAAPLDWRPAEDLPANAARQAAAAAPLIAAFRPDAALVPLPWPSHGLGLLRALGAAAVPCLAIAHLAPPQPEPIPAALLRDVAGMDIAGMEIGWAAVSAPVAGRLAATYALAAGTVAVVPNGIAARPADPARRAAQRRARRSALGLAPAAPLVLFAGRLEETKGAELLPALAEALHATAGATLVALGQGPLAARLAAHPAAGGPLRLAGQVADVADWLLAADTLVLPSRLEGWPLIFLEAAASRCPVVATAAALECLGEAAEQVASLVPLPTIAALALHISATFTHDAAVRQRIDAAEALSRRQGLDTMLRRYCAMLRACHRGAAT